MIKEKFYRIMESICPASLAEEWDNSGIQINTMYREVNRILVSLEITTDVIAEAESQEADMIVTHHPLLFTPAASIDNNDITGNFINRLISSGISVYSCHTNFDRMEGGNNDYLGEVIGLTDIEPFEREVPFCRKGVTPFEISFSELTHQIADRLEISERHFRMCGDPGRSICTVGWCTGAGAEFLQDAYEEGCDLYITGDLKYHDAQKARELDLCVLDAGHYATEKIFIDNMSEILSRKTNCEILKSKIDINPFL